MLPSSGALDPVKAPFKTVLLTVRPVGAGLVPARQHETADPIEGPGQAAAPNTRPLSVKSISSPLCNGSAIQDRWLATHQSGLLRQADSHRHPPQDKP